MSSAANNVANSVQDNAQTASDKVSTQRCKRQRSNLETDISIRTLISPLIQVSQSTSGQSGDTLVGQGESSVVLAAPSLRGLETDFCLFGLR